MIAPGSRGRDSANPSAAACAGHPGVTRMKLGLGLMLESDAGVRVPSIGFKDLRDGAGAARVEFSAFWQDSNKNSALTKFLHLLQERYAVPS